MSSNFNKGDTVQVIKAHCSLTENFLGKVGSIYIANWKFHANSVCTKCHSRDVAGYRSVVEFSNEDRFVIPNYALKKFIPPANEIAEPRITGLPFKRPYLLIYDDVETK